MKKRGIIAIASIALLLVGCGEKGEKSEETQKSIAHVSSSAQPIHELLPGTSYTPQARSETTPISSKNAVAEQMKGKVQKAVKQIVAKKQTMSGKELFGKCASCHGVDGKRKALGKSRAIAGMKREEILKKLEDYKAGTLNQYGMGVLMKGQVAGLSEKEMEALASYIASLGK